MPFLLKAEAGYADIGTFMLSTYPYSLKLLWSPIVDSFFVRSWRVPLLGNTLSLGRRKSWIVPVQLAVGVMMYALSLVVEPLLAESASHIGLLTGVFFVLIFMAATQDIAVDGWALTLLSEENVGYASTAQTVGINTGYFMSFTVFLALNSVEACNKYLRFHPRATPILTLSGYLQLCAAGFVLLTLWLLFFQEEKDDSDEQMTFREVYQVMWRICKLRHVQQLLIVHAICKIGFQAYEAVSGLKMVERGLGKEDLAFAVLIDFPFQLVFGYLAASWSKGDHALTPWLSAFVCRLGMAMVSMAIIAGMPGASAGPISSAYFLLIIATTVLSSFASTVQFVGISAFHTRIADPVIGGTYMTLLNTVSNLGGTWPRYFVLKLVDWFSETQCLPPTGIDPNKIEAVLGRANATLSLGACATDAERTRCESLGGTCRTVRDGYFVTNTLCVVIGAVTFMFYIYPVARRLQTLALPAWRVVAHAPTS